MRVGPWSCEGGGPMRVKVGCSCEGGGGPVRMVVVL